MRSQCRRREGLLSLLAYQAPHRLLQPGLHRSPSELHRSPSRCKPHALAMPADAHHDAQGAAPEANGPRLVHGVHRGQEQGRRVGAAPRPPASWPAPGHTLCGHAIEAVGWDPTRSRQSMCACAEAPLRVSRTGRSRRLMWCHTHGRAEGTGFARPLQGPLHPETLRIPVPAGRRT